MTSVGLLTAVGGEERPPVALRAPPPPRESGGPVESRELVGVICQADDRPGTRGVRIQGDGPGERVRVGEALAEDIVRPYFGRRVRVSVSKRGRAWWLAGNPGLVEDE